MSFRKSLAWSFGQEASTFILNLASSIIMARLLTPNEFGVFALGMAVTYLLSAFRDFGIGSYLIREKEITPDKIHTSFTLWASISWTLGIIIFISRNAIASLYDEPGIADVLVVLVGSFIVTPLGQPANSMLIREMRFDLLHHVNLASIIIGLSTNILLALYGLSYMALAWGLLAATITRAMALVYIRPKHSKPVLCLTHWRDVMSFGGYLTAASFAGELNQHGIKFIVAGFISPGAVALFERATQIPNLARQVIFKPLAPVIFPKLAEDIRNGLPIGSSVLNIVAFTTALVIPAFVVVGSISEAVIVFLFGENWIAAGKILPWLLISNALLTLLPQPEQILTPHGKVKNVLKIRGSVLIFNIAITTIGASHSLEAFAMLRPVLSIIFLAIAWTYMKDYIGITAKDIFSIYSKTLLITLMTSIPCCISVYYFGTKPPVPYILIILFSSAACWMLAIFLTKHEIYIEMKRIFYKQISENHLDTNSLGDQNEK